MRKRITLMLSALSLVLIFAASALAQPKNISGRLQRTTEAGGWLIVTKGEKYLLLNAQKFERRNWFKEGKKVKATGEIKRDAVTIYQEGVPFEAKTLRPVRNSSDGAANNKRLKSIHKRN